MYTLGIIGFGVVGKSLLSFLSGKQQSNDLAEQNMYDQQDADQKCLQIEVWDNRVLSKDELESIRLYGATAAQPHRDSLLEFIQRNDIIVPSPGIDMHPYHEYAHKFLSELDVFSTFFNKPSVAITGSLGKTTTTKLIAKLAGLLPRNHALTDSWASSLATMCETSEKLRVAVGGNIGVGMVDLIKHQQETDAAVLELSSFQLELNNKYAPDIAVWTNLYPNHLDRHQTLEQYFLAKFALIKKQHDHHICILSEQLLTGSVGTLLQQHLPLIRSHVVFCFTSKPQLATIVALGRIEFSYFYRQHGNYVVARVKDGVVVDEHVVAHLPALPDVTFEQNWLLVLAVLFFMGRDVSVLPTSLLACDALLDDHHHRVEHCAKISGVDFYNDSKSTVIEATQAAVDRLLQNKRPVILIVGGLSKGVDRSPLALYLSSVPLIKKVYCFGKDCAVFGSCTVMPTLDAIVNDIFAIMQPGDQVLFSPSGASFDFFKNYQHRGDIFKALVEKNKTE